MSSSKGKTNQGQSDIEAEDEAESEDDSGIVQEGQGNKRKRGGREPTTRGRAAKSLKTARVPSSFPILDALDDALVEDDVVLVEDDMVWEESAAPTHQAPPKPVLGTVPVKTSTPVMNAKTFKVSLQEQEFEFPYRSLVMYLASSVIGISTNTGS